MTWPFRFFLLEEGEPVKAAPWELKQWIGFLVYAGILVGLIVVAWRLARPDPEHQE